MEWSAKVELFEQLRLESEFGIGTIRGVARKFGVHRRLVREAAAQALPPVRKRPQRARPRLDPVIPFIDAILEPDRTAPRKQRHTARWIFHRLRQERPDCPVAESDPQRETFSREAIPSGGGVVRNMVSDPDGKLYLAESGVNKVAIMQVGP